MASFDKTKFHVTDMVLTIDGTDGETATEQSLTFDAMVTISMGRTYEPGVPAAASISFVMDGLPKEMSGPNLTSLPSEPTVLTGKGGHVVIPGGFVISFKSFNVNLDPGTTNVSNFESEGGTRVKGSIFTGTGSAGGFLIAESLAFPNFVNDD